MGFIYTDNKQVKNEFKKLVIDNNSTMVKVATKCGIVPQQLNNRFNNSRIAFSDLKEWCNVLGYEIKIEFVKQENEKE